MPPKQWDDKLKRLFAIHPEDYVHWLMPGAVFEDVVSLELKTMTRTVHADFLCKARLGRRKVLVHVEFQRKVETDMGLRVWEYNTLATIQHRRPTYSFIIYLVPCKKVPEPPLIWGVQGYWRVHHFEYKNIKLRDLKVMDLKEKGLKGLLPLCVLASDGKNYDVGDEVFEAVRDDKELLNLAMGLASLVFTSEEDQEWLERKWVMLEKIFEGTWYERRILRKGQEQGREQGQEQERAENIQTLRPMVLEIIQARFPEVMPLAQQWVMQIGDLKTLHQLITHVAIARNHEEALNAFRDLGPKS